MGRDHNDAGPDEWVNVWVASAKADAPAVPASTPELPASAEPAPMAAPAPENQLMRDIAEIERARDALESLPLGTFSARRRQALTLVPGRTGDAVPVVIGGVLALVMLTVFGAAAAMTKLSR
jgi:hypothetical protein